MTLHQLRAGMVTDLAEVAPNRYDHIPARINLPAAIVIPGLPYLAPGDTYGTFVVRHTVALVGQAGPNATVTETLDDLIEDALAALLNAGHVVSEVSPGYAYESNTGQFLAVDLTVITPHRI